MSKKTHVAEKLSFNQTVTLLKNIDPVEHIIVMIGPPGIAKSACARAFCDEVGIPPERQASLSIALNDTGDIVGFPYKVHGEDGHDTGRMGFAVPPWWLGQFDPKTGERRPLEDIHKPYDDGLDYCLVIDEANRDADPQKQAAMINLFLERNIQGRWLPKRTYIILSINEGPEYLVEDFDPAVRNRVMPIYFRPTIPEWLTWFKASDHSNVFVSRFLSKDGKQFFIPTAEYIGDRQFCSPRSLAKLGSLLNRFGVVDEKTLVNTVFSNNSLWTVLKVAINALIGNRAGKKMIAFLNADAKSNKGKYLESLGPETPMIESMKKLSSVELRRTISKMSPLKIAELMNAFIAFMNTEHFSGWDGDRDNTLLAQSIVQFASVPNDNKLKFIAEAKETETTSIFDLIEKNLERNRSKNMTPEERARMDSMAKILS